MAGKKRGLGRGLDALFADAVPINEEKETEIQKNENTEREGELYECSNRRY